MKTTKRGGKRVGAGRHRVANPQVQETTAFRLRTVDHAALESEATTLGVSRHIRAKAIVEAHLERARKPV